MRIGLFSAIVLAIYCATSSCWASDDPEEIAAKTLYGEAELLVELARPADALDILDKLRTEYPESEAATFGEFKRAECYMLTQNYADAVTLAQAVAQENSGTLLACWAQTIVGETLVLQGQTAEGLVELAKIETMLPDQRDLGPLNQARGVIGRVYNQCLKDSGKDDLEILELLGISDADSKTKADVLASLACFRGRQGRIDLANLVLQFLSEQCPDELATLDWARTQVAVGYLRKFANRGDLSDVAGGLLAQVAASPTASRHDVAQSLLELGKFHKANGEYQSALGVLQNGVDGFLDTQCGPEMLYQLGAVSLLADDSARGVETLSSIPDAFPRSGFVPAALYYVGLQSRTHRSQAVAALTRLADGGYEPGWRIRALERLGDLHRREAPETAREFYSRAINLIDQRLEEQKADLPSDWRNLLASRRADVDRKLQDLGGGEE